MKRPRRAALPSVYVIGAGKVGANLARALRARGAAVTLRPNRRGLPPRRIDADVVVIALRDGDVSSCASELAAKGLIGHRPVSVVHCAGALGPDVLEAAKSGAGGGRVAVAQMHPMISFAHPSKLPSLERGQLHVDGDARAVRAARRLGRALGMTPRTIPKLERALYHAAAGLCANGAAALAAAATVLLERAGVDRDTATAMLGPLLRSVGDNVESLGIPGALTGPVRRGDARGIRRHLDILGRVSPELVPFYVESGLAQLPLARALGESSPASFDEVAAVLDAAVERR
jgi:predicted short-subunit dehydrogenase-like oxidoreductase (DUF2520 family)